MARHQEDIRARGQMREETAFLNDVADPSADGRCGISVNFPAVENHLAAVGFQKPDDQPKQCRFPATARADERGR